MSESDYTPKELKKDTYETTPEFNKRVAKANELAKSKYNKALKSAILKYKKDMRVYEQSIKEEEKKALKAKRTLPNVLKERLKDALNFYLGKPYIESFENYNADDGAYYTKIMSSKFAMDVAIVVPLSEAKALHRSGKLKELKPEVTFEYNNGSLYISNVVVKDKNKSYKVNIIDLSNYDKTFILGRDVRATSIVWSDKPLKDKSIEKNIEKIKLLIVEKAKEKEKQKQFKLQWTKYKKKRPFMQRLISGERSYTKFSENSVKDNLQGLIWQKGMGWNWKSGNKMNFETAKEYCSNLTLDDTSDWRLPTFKELYYLADRSKYDPAIDTEYFDTKSSYYWSSTEHNNYSSTAWGVYFYKGSGDYDTKSYGRYVRCVRGGRQ